MEIFGTRDYFLNIRQVVLLILKTKVIGLIKSVSMVRSSRIPSVGHNPPLEP